MLFDTHAHLTDPRFNEDRDDIISQIKQMNMLVLNCGYDEKSSYLSMVLASRHPFLYAAVGMHPHDAKDYTDDFENKLRVWLKEDKVVALGEIGLDYHYDYSPRDTQRKVFIRQIEIADEIGCPIVIHSREASQDTFDILKNHVKPAGKVVLHSFSQSAEMLRNYLRSDKDFYFSISGPITFSNADALRQTVKEIPSDRLLIETDSPYLTPAPHRGKRNVPQYVRYVAEEIARLTETDVEDLIETTCANAKRFFSIK